MENPSQGLKKSLDSKNNKQKYIKTTKNAKYSFTGNNSMQKILADTKGTT